MLNILKITLLSLVISLSVSLGIAAQNLKLDELNTCFTAKNYPDCLFETLENKGFYRIDKQYLEYCDRVIYAYVQDARPSMFVNPVLCPKPQRSEIYPIRVKNELEIQFQKNGRARFEMYRQQIRKSCKELPDANGTVPDLKSKNSQRVYRHPVSGITFVVIDQAPVAYIYLLK